MESRVRGEKCGVIMMRMLASEKDSLWGLRMRSSSTITTGGGSWPVNTIINFLQRMESEQRGHLTSVLTFVEKNHRGVASGGILSHLVSPVILWPKTTRLHAPELTRHKHQNLGVEPATIGKLFANTSLHIQQCLSCRAMLKADVNLLHDDDVKSIHGHEEQRLPPEEHNNIHKKHIRDTFNPINFEEILKSKLILEENHYSLCPQGGAVIPVQRSNPIIKMQLPKIINRRLSKM